AQDHRQHEHDQPALKRRHRNMLRNSRRQVVAGKGAHHEHISMSEIDKTQDSIDHGVAQRNQGENRSEGEAVDQLLKEFTQSKIVGSAQPKRLSNLSNSAP